MKKIRIAGTIISNDNKWIYDWYEMESFCLNDFLKGLDTNEDIEIEINSPGGSVYAGSEIYTAILNHKGKTKILITGIAASAASVIAMAGDEVIMSPTAQIMIHNVSAYGSGGDYHEHEKVMNALKEANESIANAYMIKTGLSKEEILDLMDNETWLSAEKAKEYNFIDEILNWNNQSDGLELVASISPEIIPFSVIEKMKRNKLQQEINLLKLKGEQEIG